MFLKQGHTEAELPRLRKKWDDDCDDYMKMMGGSPPIAGQKPNFGASDFQVYRIPGSQYAIRIWDDEKERSDGQFL
ncbi:hypothetical protein BJ138DRAFT_1113874 [Hygrophoropsis aurantiaca]|uniref:Uncharacterized protein n=1 Tax=Hygrophoropsis aurantiaca TaxID=72124 RepID=A0ACB8AD63_9AGAM|nr:hypothetical protein BJ138DRAFT_1113874 [Hygrophoropsis aurantiaca]